MLTPLKDLIEREKQTQKIKDLENAIQYLAQENNAIIEKLNKINAL